MLLCFCMYHTFDALPYTAHRILLPLDSSYTLYTSLFLKFHLIVTRMSVSLPGNTGIFFLFLVFLESGSVLNMQ